ncbi:MAG: type II secretion system minor pseudopilin GspK [Deltaproteobacteria bacterium]|jgi:general secretion pathway protein K
MKRWRDILKNQSGVALIAVILVVGILLAAALEFNRSTRADVYFAANASDGLKLSCIAKSGFYGAAALLADSQSAYETLRDDWADAEALSARSQTLFADGRFVVRIEDEKGKIPLNKLVSGGAVNEAVKGMLLRLLLLPEFDLDEYRATQIVDALIDWIDENSEVTGMGAETSYYASLPAPYAAKNAPLDCIEEMLMIRGITNELFAGTGKKPALGRLVTVYGTGVVNINTAPKMVLRALAPDITAEKADRMDEYRRNPINNLSSADWYKRVPGMGGITINPELIEVAKSNFFRIQATGVIDKMESSVVGVIQRSPLQIMSWRQD